MQTIKEIDLAKRKLEAKFIPVLKKIFHNLAYDAKILYLAQGRIPAKALSLHYRPEFLTVIRNAQRAAIKEFGFDSRKEGEKKGYAFKTVKHKALIDYQIQTKEVDPALSDSKIDIINQEFAVAATYFAEEQSNIQADYITQTNEKEIINAEALAVILFFETQTKLEVNLIDAQNDLRKLDLERFFGVSSSISEAKRKKVEKKIAKLEKELEDLNKNKDKFIADEIEKKLLAKADSRSSLIAEQNVGLGQSWAKATEENLIADNIEGTELEQHWRAILDSHTRPDHSAADGQKKENGFYTVGGHRCTRPFDPNLPIDQVANCRCQEETKIIFPDIDGAN